MTTFQGQLKSLQDNQKLLGLLLFSLITVVIWISISLLTSQEKTTISAESQALAKPLNPTINTAILDSIENKRVYQASELSTFPIYTLLKEKGNQSIFESTDQTVTIQPATLNNFATPLATDSATAQQPEAPTTPETVPPLTSLDTPTVEQ